MAAAFFGEHSFASDTVLIANGRPNSKDRDRAEAFRSDVSQRINALNDISDIAMLEIPG